MTFSMAVEELRELAAGDIADIISDYVELKRSGRGMKGICPFHDERTPSFHVSEDKSIYKCFGCGLGGDVIEFMMRMEGKEFHEVIFQLADRFHVTIDRNHRERQESRVRKESAVIANIKEIRSDIRKAEKVTVVLNSTPVNRFQTKAVTCLKPPLQREQARVLKKYTSRCVLELNGLDWPLIHQSLAVCLAADFEVLVLDGDEERDWLRFILSDGKASREDIIKLLAHIPDDLSRSIYMSEYSGFLNQLNENET